MVNIVRADVSQGNRAPGHGNDTAPAKVLREGMEYYQATESECEPIDKKITCREDFAFIAVACSAVCFAGCPDYGDDIQQTFI